MGSYYRSEKCSSVLMHVALCLTSRYDAGARTGSAGMSVWHRSTEEGSVAAPQAQPSFGGGPPPLLPPTHGQRRFNFLIVGVTILLAAGLVAGLVLSNGHRSKPSPVDSTKSAVHQAFLAYYSAVEQSYKQLDLTPLHPFVTTDGLKQEQGHMDAAV